MLGVTVATVLASTVWALMVIAVSAVVLALAGGAALELSVLGQAKDLVFVIAEFRNPRHMLLTAQSFTGGVQAFGVLAEAILILAFLCRTALRAMAARALALCITVAVLSAAGFYLVEAIPTRLGLAIQGGRLLYVILFLFVVAGVALSERLVLFLCPDFISALRPHWTRVEQIAARIRAPILAALVGFGVVFAPFFSSWASVSIARVTGYAPRLAMWQESFMTPGGTREADQIAIAIAMRALPPDALVLAPPDFGLIRILAPRALYVDYKAWSFTAPMAWAARMMHAYGPLDRPGGFAWRQRAEESWATTPCTKLVARAGELGASHVVIEGRAVGCGTPLIMAGRFLVLPAR
jgi:hypothetical protein